MEENNIGESIYDIINTLFSKIFSSIDNGVYSILDEITFINTKIIENENLIKIVGNSNKEGILLICNALVLGFIIFFSINYLISHLTFGKSQTPSQFIFKCIIYIALMNCSIWICGEIINLVSIVSEIIRELGENIFNEKISFSNFVLLINKEVYLSNQEIDAFSFRGIAKSFTSVGFMNLIFTYSLRYVMIQICIIIAPFAFLCLLIEKTDWFFSSWIKMFLSLLLEQVLISVILVLGFSISKLSNFEIKELLYIGIIYALVRCNTYMNQLFGGISTSVSTNVSNLMKIK